jgi:hypothetical protein
VRTLFSSLTCIRVLGLHVEVGEARHDKAVLAERVVELEQDLSLIRRMAGTLYSHVLGGEPNAVPLVARLEAVRGHVEELVTDGVYIGSHAAFAAMGSHYKV